MNERAFSCVKSLLCFSKQSANLNSQINGLFCFCRLNSMSVSASEAVFLPQIDVYITPLGVFLPHLLGWHVDPVNESVFAWQSALII